MKLTPLLVLVPAALVLVPAAASDCLGFDVCPPFPLPYNGSYPYSYSYEGTFPAGFVWGLGTASYQIEGAYNEDGRGASIWDTFTGANTVGMPGSACAEAPCPINVEGGMYDVGATGNVANDHYHKYKEDVAMMKAMGLKHYRFSIAWPRVVPTGKVEDGVNELGLQFYDDLIDELLAAGITPWVTLYHWDLPQGLLAPMYGLFGWYSVEEDGATPSGQIVPHFVDFARVVFGRYGDRVKHWLTFNEAWTFTWLGGGWGKAPALPAYSGMDTGNGPKWAYVAMHNVLWAHGAAVDLYRTTFQAAQGGKIGITNNCDWREPLTRDARDVAAAERAIEFQLGWASDPIFGAAGDYPAAMRELVGDALPVFTAEQKALIQGSADFYGLNHYGTGWAQFDEGAPGADKTYATVSEGAGPNGPAFVRAQSVWLFGSGWGFRKMLNWVSNRYARPEIYVTEGGWSLAANSSADGTIDPERTYYYANYTSAMLQAIEEDGVDVKGYFAWSLMDNFEWERGYAERFGQNFNDFAWGYDPNAAANQYTQPTTNQTRFRKDSSCWYEQVYTTNALVSPATFPGCAK